MTDAVRTANGRFARGFSCAQSVFSAFAEQFGIAADLALHLPAPFGGGLARQGETCGALSGALMILGLRYGQDRPEGKEEMYRITREFMDGFKGRHGALRCSDILGFDISTPQGMQAAREKNVFATMCPLIVDETAKALERYLNEHPGS